MCRVKTQVITQIKPLINKQWILFHQVYIPNSKEQALADKFHNKNYQQTMILIKKRATSKSTSISKLLEKKTNMMTSQMMASIERMKKWKLNLSLAQGRHLNNFHIAKYLRCLNHTNGAKELRH